MVVNLSALSNVTTAATGLSNLILVTPQKTVGYQPQLKPTKTGAPQQQQPPALLFNYEGEQSISLQSDITDHFVEDNTAIQDQIALRPEKITTTGFIGELNDVSPRALALLKFAADKLTVISAYAPVLSVTALIAYNTAFQIYQTGSNVLNSAVASWSSLSGSGGTTTINGTDIDLQKNQNKQQVAFQQFYGYWRDRTLFTVQTPWAIFQNMAIESLRAMQDAETRVITNFEITFKLMRFASTITENGPIISTDITNFQSRLANQAAGLTDLGTSTPVPDIGLSQGLTDNYAALVG